MRSETTASHRLKLSERFVVCFQSHGIRCCYSSLTPRCRSQGAHLGKFDLLDERVSLGLRKTRDSGFSVAKPLTETPSTAFGATSSIRNLHGVVTRRALSLLLYQARTEEVSPWPSSRQVQTNNQSRVFFRSRSLC